MGKIIVSENITLDGLIEDPTGERGFARGGWFNQMSEHDRAAWAEVEYAEALAAEALPFGRGSYEYFVAKGWSSRTDPWADRLGILPKYVVSSTLRDPEWSNTTVIGGDVADEVSKLRQNLEGEIVVYGSQQLVPVLFEHDLVDELRLTIHPFVLGAGERLFGETGVMMPLHLVEARVLGKEISHLTYERVR